ncbi:D-amino acid dehydrogenase small subunit [Mycobacterium basiliense]|uniref:D-amino acid dehydrogenase small subunit n=1 Tax=Mycobacterium basiliense TaxID=2094119 RepID=A0A3S4BVU2_9MYCO|nr:FAD-dependent oxidoreductase [Mycobacterium basiliense]VDM88742.1 D-amino acid dehydrogenase small subunit [Mycobacterium basiliense]
MTPTDRPTAVVIGAGVSGWTTALVLAKRGWRVIVAADRFGLDTVSTMAGALWEWPSAGRGALDDHAAPARSAVWAIRSYLRFAQFAADTRTGVSLRPAVFSFPHRIEEDPVELAKMTMIEQFVPAFVHDSALIDTHGINRATGVIDSYCYLAPTIDTDWYLVWLAREAKAAGVVADRRRIRGPLIEQEQRLCAEYGAQLIVNCAGLGARELAQDETVDPHRGAFLWVVNDGTRQSRVTAAHVLESDAGSDGQNVLSIVPRGADRLLLGGLVEPGQHDTELDLTGYPPLQEIFDRCIEFLPALRGSQPDALCPVQVGLRPFRRDGARVEAQPGSRIVHNYGHGGDGVTLSWGCAQEVADLAYGMLATRGAA